MAERNNLSLNFSRGRVRALIEAIEHFERRRGEGHGSSPPPVGRAGITPRNLTLRNIGRSDMCGWKEGGQIQKGRAGAPGMICNLREQCPWHLSTWTGRGRGWGFFHISLIQSPTTTTLPLSERRGKALAPPSPPPLEDHPLTRRHQEDPLRCPHTLPQCLQPMVGSPALQIYPLQP